MADSQNAVDKSENRWNLLRNDQQENLCERLGLIRTSSFARQLCSWHELPQDFKDAISAHFEAYP